MDVQDALVAISWASLVGLTRDLSRHCIYLELFTLVQVQPDDRQIQNKGAYEGLTELIIPGFDNI